MLAYATNTSGQNHSSIASFDLSRPHLPPFTAHVVNKSLVWHRWPFLFFPSFFFPPRNSCLGLQICRSTLQVRFLLISPLLFLFIVVLF